jgi:hypothetical protein
MNWLLYPSSERRKSNEEIPFNLRRTKEQNVYFILLRDKSAQEIDYKLSLLTDYVSLVYKSSIRSRENIASRNSEDLNLYLSPSNRSHMVPTTKSKSRHYVKTTCDVYTCMYSLSLSNQLRRVFLSHHARTKVPSSI